MKSVFLLCDYDIPISIVEKLDNNNITLEQIINDNSCLDKVFGKYSSKKDKLIEMSNIIEKSNQQHSIYELIKYGLSYSAANNLVNLGITFDDIKNSDFKGKNNISKSTYNKIINAYKKCLAVNGEDICLDFHTIDELENYGLSHRIINKLVNLGIAFDDIKNSDFKDKNNISKSTYNKIINAYKKCLAVNEEDICLDFHTIDELGNYGLSRGIVNKLVNLGITFDNLNNKNIREKYNIGKSTYNKIMRSYEQFLKKNNITLQINEQTFVEVLKSYYGYNAFSLEEIEKKLNENNYRINEISKMLESLAFKGIIKQSKDMYFFSRPKLQDELCKISNKKNHYDMIMKKLSGQTLESIGKEYNVTRERIRQIIQKELKKVPVVYEEERYKDLFTTYHFDCDLFCELYNEDKTVYYYLKDKYNIGYLEPSELIEHNNFSKNQLNVLKKRYNLVYICGENIVANRTNLLLVILKNNNNSIEYNELVNQYNNLIIEYNLNLDLLSEADFRNIDRLLSSSVNVLCGFGRYYRYYNTDELDDDDILNLQKMLNVDSGDYSAEFFYQNNLELMKRIDIRNGYELHNLLRKKIGNFNNKIIYSRMPDVLIDCDNKREFILNKIQELSPITLEDFTDYMYKNYGHKVNSFTALIQSEFCEFITNGIIISNSPEFTPEQFNILKQKLKDDIYSIVTIKKMLTELFDVDNFKLLNNLNLSKLGYKLKGNYIMKSDITNLEAYLRDLISTTDYYELNQEMKQIGSTFTSYIYKFIYNLDLFKIGENKYITIKKLNDLNITKEEIKNFIKKIDNHIIYNNYFNLYTLRKKIDINFCNRDFPDCFYETLISTIPNIKTFRMKNNYLFIKTDENATRERFINSFIKKDKTYIYEIKKEILNDYHIDLEEYYIREFINRKKYYFDSSTDCVYLNKDIYEKEINDFDILQFIDR